MTWRNFRHSAFREKKFRLLVRLFCLYLEATKIDQLTGLNRNSVNFFCRHFWERIATIRQASRRCAGRLRLTKAISAASAGAFVPRQNSHAPTTTNHLTIEN